MSKPSYTAQDRETARAILRYLRKYPEAKDTLEGIAQWWLPWQACAPGLGLVERAVSLLLSEGLLLETGRRGLPPWYQLNPRRRAASSKSSKGGTSRILQTM